MKKLMTILACGAFGFLIILHFACSSSSTPTGGYGNSPTPTPVPGGSGLVTATTSNTFNPAAVTITHGNAVTFVLGGGSHTLYIDNGSGTCVQNYNTWPQTITFPTAGTYHFHCSNHSTCGTSSCSACTGMAGFVVVQ